MGSPSLQASHTASSDSPLHAMTLWSLDELTGRHMHRFSWFNKCFFAAFRCCLEYWDSVNTMLTDQVFAKSL